MQFHRDAVGERLGQPREQAFGLRLLAFASRRADRTGGAAGQQDQPCGVRRDRIERELRLQAGIGVEEAERRQALQVGEPGRVLRQQHDRVGRQARIVGAAPARSGSR